MFGFGKSKEYKKLEKQELRQMKVRRANESIKKNETYNNQRNTINKARNLAFNNIPLVRGVKALNKAKNTIQKTNKRYVKKKNIRKSIKVNRSVTQPPTQQNKAFQFGEWP